MTKLQLGVRSAILLFCYANVLVNINRGLISGAPESFQTFISKSLGVGTDRQNFYLGLLESIYLASALVFAVVFGYLSMIGRKPIPLLAAALATWMLAAVVSGLAYHTNSYYLLALGRLLAGVGEAGMRCIVTPFTNRHAPSASRTLWLGFFVASIIVGSAVGYVYGATFASSSLTWAAGFYLEIVLMAPVILLIVFCIPDELGALPVELLGDLSVELVVGTDANTGRATAFAQRWTRVFTTMPFPMVALGYAAYAFTIVCFSTFSPTLMIGLGFFHSESEASLPFGIIVLVCGAGGTVLGGILLDRLASNHHAITSMKRVTIAADMLFVLISIAVAFGVAAAVSTASKIAYLALFSLTYLFIASAGPAAYVAAMELFPESLQPMAIAANFVVGYVFGDIPSPVVLGVVKDAWAPRCGTVQDLQGKSHLNPDCHLDRAGLRNVQLFSILWLCWAVAFWGMAKWTLGRKSESTKRVVIESPALTS